MAVVGPLVLMALVAASCRKVDQRPVRLHVPGMKTPACEALIGTHLQGVHGVIPGSVRFDSTHRAIELTYDSMRLSLKNLEFEVAGLGFAVNNTPADKAAAAKLPPACR